MPEPMGAFQFQCLNQPYAKELEAFRIGRKIPKLKANGSAHQERQDMLQAVSALKDYAIRAEDGLLGTVSDFLFDDRTWKVRWLVVDAGTWLNGAKGPGPSVGDWPGGQRPAGTCRRLDEGSGQGQPWNTWGPAGFAADAERAVRLLRAGPAMGWRNVRRGTLWLGPVRRWHRRHCLARGDGGPVLCRWRGARGGAPHA